MLAPFPCKIQLFDFEAKVIFWNSLQPREDAAFERRCMSKICAQQVGEKLVHDRDIENITNLEHRAAIDELFDRDFDRMFEQNVVRAARCDFAHVDTLQLARQIRDAPAATIKSISPSG